MRSDRFAKTGLQFCGLMMGDHSKCGINMMFNTGTVVGVSANIYGSGYPEILFLRLVGWPFWADNVSTKKVFQVAEAVMKRRDKVLSVNDQNILTAVFELTKNTETPR